MNQLSFQYCFHGKRYAGRRVNAHMHNSCELVYYASGGGTVFFGGEARAFSGGMVGLTHPGTVHSESWGENGDVWCLVFDAGEEKLSEGVYDDRDGDILPLIEAFFREQQADRSGRDEILRGYLAMILSLMARSGRGPCREPSPREDRLDNAYRYIQDHYMTEIAFDELALSIGYSYDRFRHLFKQRYHVSPKQMALAMRLALAKQMLRQREEKIENIAFACGFSSASQFNVIFKKHRGMTPSEYRSMDRGNEE